MAGVILALCHPDGRVARWVMTDDDGAPFSGARAVDDGQHRDLIEQCVSCGGATVRYRSIRAGRPCDEFDWCPRCGLAMWCACEACEVLRALAAL